MVEQPPQEPSKRLAPSLLRYRYWKRWGLRVKGLRVLIVDLGAIAGVIGIVAVIANQLMRDTIQIEPIQVPNQLLESGHAPEALAQRLMTFALAIHQKAEQVHQWKLPEDLVTARGKSSDDHQKSASRAARNDVAVPSIGIPPQMMGGARTDFVVPGLSFSMNTLTTYVGELFGKRSKRVRGEVVKIGDLYSLRLRFDDSPEEFISIRVPEAYLDDALRTGAEEIERRTDKLAFAVYLQEQGKKKEALALLEELMKTSPEGSVEHVNSYNFRGLMYSDEGKFDDAIICHKTAADANPDDLTSYINLASALRSGRRYDEAITAAEQAIKLDSKNVPARITYGATLLAMGDAAGAIEKFEIVVQLDSKNLDGHRGLGQALEQNGEIDRAIEIYNKMIEIDPNSAEAYIGLGNLYFDKGELNNAIEYYNKALQVNPNEPEAYRNLGLALEQKGDIPGAIENYSKKIKIDPDKSDAYIDLGNIHYGKGEYDEAIKIYRRALIANPKEPFAYSNIGLAFQQKGDLEQAIKNFNLSIEINPDDPITYVQLGDALRQKGDVDGAITSYRNAIEIDPNNVDAYVGLGAGLSIKGELDAVQLEEAEANLRRALELDQRHAWAFSALCLVQGQRGQLSEAIANCRQSIALSPNDSMLYDNLGEVLTLNGDTDQAIQNFEDAIRLEPKLGWPYSDWGNALFDKGDREGAFSKFNTAVGLDTDNADYSAFHYAARGLANLQLGRHKEAVDDFNEAIALNSNFAIGHFGRGHALYEGQKQADGIAACRRGVELAPSGELPKYDPNFGISGTRTLATVIARCREIAAQVR